MDLKDKHYTKETHTITEEFHDKSEDTLKDTTVESDFHEQYTLHPEDISNIHLPDEEPRTIPYPSEEAPAADKLSSLSDSAEKKRRVNRWDRTTKDVSGDIKKTGFEEENMSDTWDSAQAARLAESQKRIQMAEDEEEDDNHGVDE